MTKKILIDPGHFTGVNRSPVVPSYYEGNQMWKLSQYLIPKLEAYGFEVGCTKKSMADYPKDSKGQDAVTTRGRMGKGYDFVLSLHSNAAASASVERVSVLVFVDDNCGEIDNISYNLGKKLGETVKETMGRSKINMVQRKSSNDRDGDGYKNDDYYGFLFGAHQVGAPAVLMEHGFHTHAATAQWLLSDANLEKLAEAEAKCLAEYFGMTAIEAGWVQNETGKWWRNADGTWPAGQWKVIDGAYYYFNDEGYLAVNQIVDGTGRFAGSRFYCGADGKVAVNTTVTVDGQAYSADEAGRLSRINNEEGTGMFKDVKDDAWYKADVEAVAQMGIMQGVGDGKFEPDRPITRAEMAAVVNRIIAHVKGN